MRASMTDPSKHDDPFNIPSSSTQIETEPTTNQEIPLNPTRFQVRVVIQFDDSSAITTQVMGKDEAKALWDLILQYFGIHSRS
ncbi:hypothetical protein E6C27_scaffold60G002540 [Cucumis melo var. makuwa]|uniref:Uncharacterized protein n=1 Tax=Cucumis melo var. makuwa TaxID=1194695 RepID=A0A5A7UEA5_CUCMM|nr:hypothetical protein E6C27_scaffold60G002540 [Cucumis melo var. makuwa]